MNSLTRFASLGAHRLLKAGATALLLAFGGPACSSDSGTTPNTGGVGGSSAAGAGTSSSGTGGAGPSGAGTSASGTAGAATSGAGAGGSAGSGSSGAGAGGSGATTMAAGSGGGGAAGNAGSSSAGAGGNTPRTPFQCDPSDGSAVGTPNSCAPVTPADACQKCVQAKCCTEFGECFATNPGNQCGWGGPAQLNGINNYSGEIACMQVCLIAAVAEAGTAPDTSQVNSCANACATSISNGATKECGPVIGSQTSALVGCLLSNCSTACFGG